MEIWKDIKGFSNYKVSNTGEVKSFKSTKQKILKQKTERNGYNRLAIYSDDKKRREFCTHQLVAIAFLGHKIDGWKIVVDHINGIRNDNRVENLRLITNRENIYAHHKGTSKFKGVSWCNDRKTWVAQININGKKIALGRFKNEIDAHNAYQNKLK